MSWRESVSFGTVRIKKSLILDGGSLRGLLGTNGNEYWVDSGAGTDGVGRGGQKTSPVATFDYGIGLCTADQGDVIHLMEGHAETLATAGAVAWDVDGITVVVHGEGDSRPTFTFSDVAATIAISGNSAKAVGKMILIPSVDNVVSPVVISGTDVDVEFESRDASATVEFVGIVLTTTAAHKLAVDLKHIGFSGGAAGVTAIELNGVEDARINVDYYGISATAIVEFTGNACNDILITGTFNNIGTTNLLLNVVDTVTGSTWAVDGFDAAAGAAFSGGDGNAIAIGDLSTIAAGIVTIEGLHDVPTANATTDAYIRDVVGRKTDAGVQAVTTTKSLMAYQKAVLDILAGTTGIAAFPTAAAAANAVSIAEVVRYMSENQSDRVVSKTITLGLGAVTVTETLFTVTGEVEVAVVGYIDTAVTSAGALTLELGVVGATAGFIAASAVGDLAIDLFWTDTVPSVLETKPSMKIIANGANIIHSIKVASATAGAITYHCYWRPLSSDGNVVAA